MGKKNRNNRQSRADLQRRKGSKELRSGGTNRPRNLVFSLALLDKNQGQDYEDWEEHKLLSKALNRIQGICSMTYHEAVQSDLISVYTPQMPPKTEFERPKHIPEDVIWSSIRIQGQERIIGYIESGYIFQVVFLDKTHKFYPSEKKNHRSSR